MKKLLLGIFIFLFLCSGVDASLKINELYPAPPSGEMEWVELYNDTDEAIDISGYAITDDKNNALMFETNTASPSAYFLATSMNVLNNSGDSVILKNTAGEIIDTIRYTETFSADKSYSRCSDTSGDFIQTADITKRASNQTACITPTQIATATPTQTPIATSEITSAISYDGIYISEAMVNPVEESEWVELYNDNDFPVVLKNWLIDDVENSGSSPKTISLNIAAKSYGVYELTSSMFNNSADSVRLLDSTSTLKDSFTYYSSAAGNTLGKPNPKEHSICIMEATKGDSNELCITMVTPLTSSPTIAPTLSPTLGKISPSQIPTSKPTIKPTIRKNIPTVHLPQSLFKNEIQSTREAKQEPNKEQVLGAKTAIKEKPPGQFPLWRILSAAAGSLSFLTIGSILFRMKYRNVS